MALKRIILPVLPLIIALFISCGDSYSDMLEGGFSGTFLHVTYDSNNSTSGTPPTDMNTYSTGLSVTVPDNSGVLDRTGYTFNGWNTAPDGSGTGYSPLDSFTIGSNSVTLYAWWIPIPFTVTFDPQGGSAVSPQTENYDSLVTEPAAPARRSNEGRPYFRRVVYRAGLYDAMDFCGRHGDGRHDPLREVDNYYVYPDLHPRAGGFNLGDDAADSQPRIRRIYGYRNSRHRLPLRPVD